MRAYKLACKHGIIKDPLNATQIVEALLCSLATAYRWTEAARERLKKERDEAIAKKKAEGKSNRQIAKEVGVDDKTVGNALRKNSDRKNSAPQQEASEPSEKQDTPVDDFLSGAPEKSDLQARAAKAEIVNKIREEQESEREQSAAAATPNIAATASQRLPGAWI